MTVFNLPANHLGQLGGAYQAAKANYAGATALEIIYGNGCIQGVNGDSAVAAAVAVTCGNVPAVGLLIVNFRATGAGTVTYTLGAGFLVNGTVAPTTGKQIAVAFVSNGTNFVELCRTSAAV